MERTLTALYQSRADADAAAERLKAAQLGADVDICDENSAEETAGEAGGGFMDKIAAFFGGHEDTHTYAEGVRRGHFLLTAKVDELRATEAAELLNATDAVDLDRTEQDWKSEGWRAPENGAGRADVSGREDEQVIPVADERLVVAKREVDRGGVRVRSYVVEKPVTETVGLREEHVSVERRPVDRAAAGDADFAEREISLKETAEEAVVAKEPFVREEVVIRRDATERTEKIQDTVRHTEVEVDDTTSRDAAAKDFEKPRPL